jgi:beta-N-acetylhexosaminidase
MSQDVSYLLGPLMIDIAGTELTLEDKRRLCHPWVGGVILFRRNFSSVAQLCALTREIHALRKPHLLIGVDHEGGRVQRFREGFTHIPPMRRLGEVYDTGDCERALRLAKEAGWLLASELRASGVDFSFAPVLDLDYGTSSVISDRAFHSDPQVVTELAKAFIAGLHQAGMAHVVKHFPGHGYVKADSHLELPEDDRSLAEIQAADWQPFKALIESGALAVMPAHIRFTQVDDEPVGFSKVWLQDLLRGALGFQGAIISDDMMMQGAVQRYPDIRERVSKAIEAGCDLVLVCNNPQQVDVLLEDCVQPATPLHELHLLRLRGQGQLDWATLQVNKHYVQVAAAMHHLHKPLKTGEEWVL